MKFTLDEELLNKWKPVLLHRFGPQHESNVNLAKALEKDKNIIYENAIKETTIKHMPKMVCNRFRGNPCVGSIDGKTFLYKDGSSDLGRDLTMIINEQ